MKSNYTKWKFAILWKKKYILKMKDYLSFSKFITPRAKRGGSLFEGSSVGEEGSRSDPKFAWGARLRSLVFSTSFAPNVEIFGWNLAQRVFVQFRTERFFPFWNWPPGGRAICVGRWKIWRFGHFGGFSGYLGLTKVVKAPTKHVQVSFGVLELMPETFAHRRCMWSAFRCVS